MAVIFEYDPSFFFMEQVLLSFVFEKYLFFFFKKSNLTPGILYTVYFNPTFY